MTGSEKPQISAQGKIVTSNVTSCLKTGRFRHLVFITRGKGRRSVVIVPVSKSL